MNSNVAVLYFKTYSVSLRESISLHVTKSNDISCYIVSTIIFVISWEMNIKQKTILGVACASYEKPFIETGVFFCKKIYPEFEIDLSISVDIKYNISKNIEQYADISHYFTSITMILLFV